MIELQVTDATTDVTLPATRAERVRDLDEQARATVAVYRDDWLDVEGEFDELDATLTIREDGADFFGGRFGDATIDGVLATVEIVSFEEDAADAEPTGPNLQFQNVKDSAIATDAINAIPTLSAGTVETVVSSISYSASHASRSKILRDLRAATGAEVRYNADQTVDYVARLGTDRTGSVTLSPSAQTLGEGFSKDRDIREEVTHVRVLGAQSGPDQVTAEAVASSYDGGRQRWKRHSNKEIIDANRAQQTADTLVAEYDGEPRALRVETTVYDAGLNLGDSVTVDYPDAGIESRELRVVSLRTIRDQDGRRQVATLANRSLTREQNDRAKEVDDIQTFNRGYQGFVDRDQATSGWDVAGDGAPQSLLIPAWPDDIETANRVELVVEGRPWRSAVDSSGHSHGVTLSSTETSASNSDFQRVVDKGFSFDNTSVNATSWTAAETFTPSGATSVFVAYAWYRIPSDSDAVGVAVRLRNTDTGFSTITENFFTESQFLPLNVTMFDPSNCDGQQMAVEFRSASNVGYVESGTAFEAWGLHNHTVDVNDSATTDSEVDLEPRVTESFGGQTFYPADVEIAVDGNAVTTISGSTTSDWTESVDLTGALSPGSNRITATPTTSRGELRLSLASELFRRGAQS